MVRPTALPLIRIPILTAFRNGSDPNATRQRKKHRFSSLRIFTTPSNPRSINCFSAYQRRRSRAAIVSRITFPLHSAIHHENKSTEQVAHIRPSVSARWANHHKNKTSCSSLNPLPARTFIPTLQVSSIGAGVLLVRRPLQSTPPRLSFSNRFKIRKGLQICF